ncbi:hypothetical protein Dimus_025208, partial [Dionaea muscipula]
TESEMRAWVTAHGAERERPFFIESIFGTLCHTKTAPHGVTVNDLHARYTLLCLWISDNLVPKGGHLATSRLLLHFSFLFLLTHEEIDVANIIVREMASMTIEPRRALGFGALLTRIFSHFEIGLTRMPAVSTKASSTLSLISRSRILDLQYCWSSSARLCLPISRVYAREMRASLRSFGLIWIR